MSHFRILVRPFVFLSIIALISGSSPPFDRTSLQLYNSHHSGQDGETPQSNSKTSVDIVRLTDEVIPTAYELRIIPDLEKFTFAGKVEISIHAKFGTSQIKLHSRKLKIDSIRVLKTDRSRTPIENTHEIDETNDLLYINLAQSLTFDTDYTLAIEFQGEIGENLVGFYRSSYVADGRVIWLAVTQFEPNHARAAFPCFDEPRFRTPFTIYIARLSNRIAVSNMPTDTVLPSDSTIGPNRVWERFQRSPPMPTYLVSYMVSDYTFITDPEGIIRVIWKKEVVQRGGYALKQAAKALKQLEGYTGISHKIKKIDIVALPDFKMGGMENWGMVTFKEHFVITDEGASSAQHRHIITQLISHEFAHQWFGNLVTPAWYNYLWLKEGFATYFETATAAAIEPTWDLDQLFVIEYLQEALWEEVYTQRAMTTSIRRSDQLDKVYDVISYAKAGSIIRMFEHMISPNSFRNALHNFLKEGDANSNGVVTEKQLLDAFEAEASRSAYVFPSRTSISDIMRSWSENIGFPLINVNRNYESGIVEITQKPYQAVDAPGVLPNQGWKVPLTYTTKSELQFTDTRPTSWSFSDEKTELKNVVWNTEWILLNLKQTGYYRVNYDAKNWNLLIDQLKESHEKIHVLNRAQLISDVYALAYDQHLSYRVAIKLTEYLYKETDMIPWYAAIKAFNELRYKSQYSLSDGFFMDYLFKLIKAQYEKIGFEIKSTDNHVAKIVKPLILNMACSMDVQDCTSKAVEEYTKNEADLTKIQPDLKRLVYCYAIRHSKEPKNVFNKLWETYTKYDIAYEKSRILSALTCAQDEEIIKNVLSKMFDSKNNEIRKEDRSNFLVRLAWYKTTMSAVIAFINEKIPTISELNEDGIALLKTLLGLMQYNLKTENQIQQIKELETKFSSLDQTKYAEFVTMSKSAQTTSANAIKYNDQKIDRIKKEALQSDDGKPKTDDTKPDSNPTPETTQPPNSAASISTPILGWNLFAAGAVLFYTFGFLKV